MVRSPQEIQEAGRTMTPSVTDTDAEESDPEEGNEVNEQEVSAEKARNTTFEDRAVIR
jgi:hypothetical protein